MRIRFETLSKSFDELKVLDRIDFDEEISTLAIIGSSGGGKSTLLRMIGGLIEPTSGRIVMDGQPIKEKGADLLKYRRSVGFVFQQNGLLKHLSAIDNITMPLVKVHGMDRDKARDQALHLLKQFGLEQEADKFPYALSGGQSQRIAIARAVAPNPGILLLDEPTSALDPEYTIEVLNMIRELKEAGMHFIIVTHEMGFARNACEHTMFLSGGKIREYGKSENLFSNPQSPELRKFLATLLEWNVKK